MSEPLALIVAPFLTVLEPAFRKGGLATARAWELTEDQRPQVRAIVHAGEVVLTQELLASLPALGLIACVSVGYDGIDVGWCRANGIEVTHARGLNAEDVADHAIGLLLAAWRNIPALDRIVREGRWKQEERIGSQPSLGGRTLGVVGLGHIGAAVARRAEALRLKVQWWAPREKPAAPWPRAESLLALARDSDILVICARAEAGNRGMVSREVIEAVGSQGMIVNVGRGQLIDEDALIAALKDGRLWRAALDVFVQEPTPAERWADVPNAVLTTHTAGSSNEAVPLMVAQAIDNVHRFLRGEELASPVAPVAG
ncbi:NAD(P)-dependent oxidoreductase [Phenylobacterium sp.]|jgi:lactate dehydrogenase-like 2-hydroxyacid dehydrogenase|uniref:NAD(P)-dependent oxidoreductase n=1 Tax=Phenylobacterium sp. TaxID=1871053 RepID=UPI002E36D19D|nr:NAD(P)-dependent oxidoreductase [Phenylobacterium sp.]HEX3366537.1 NAD(P)-dependent oxidoreductase [Phenylobacterium sp.]